MSFSTLYFKAVNPHASRTLLLLDGAFSSHREWDLVSTHLSSYHLLVPDRPANGPSSSANIPFAIPYVAAILADLVTKHSKNGKADVIGLSLRGYRYLYGAEVSRSGRDRRTILVRLRKTMASAGQLHGLGKWTRLVFGWLVSTISSKTIVSVGV